MHLFTLFPIIYLTKSDRTRLYNYFSPKGDGGHPQGLPPLFPKTRLMVFLPISFGYSSPHMNKKASRIAPAGGANQKAVILWPEQVSERHQRMRRSKRVRFLAPLLQSYRVQAPRPG